MIKIILKNSIEAKRTPNQVTRTVCVVTDIFLDKVWLCWVLSFSNTQSRFWLEGGLFQHPVIREHLQKILFCTELSAPPVPQKPIKNHLVWKLHSNTSRKKIPQFETWTLSDKLIACNHFFDYLYYTTRFEVITGNKAVTYISIRGKLSSTGLSCML